MVCNCCGEELSKAITRGEYKSCPKCSQIGEEHIFYPLQDFGWTEKRITENNPSGIQSWCTECRGGHDGPHEGAIRCSMLV